MIKWFNIDKSTLPCKSIQDYLNDSNWHGCCFKKYYYSNLWIINLQWSTNLSKSMWKLVFNVTDVIFLIGSSKRKTHKVHMNNSPCIVVKKYAFGTKKLKTNKNCNSYGLMKIWLNFNRSKVLIIKQLKFSNKSSYEFNILYYIIYWVPITNLECESI